jgi:DNA (cytosine-5)-methyltransferase 1
MNEIISLLGGKSVNGDHVWFPHEDSVPYHVYFKVMNAKKHGVPQNRERVFIIGIRDDEDNQFQFPKEEHLTRRLKDVLESEVDGKYFLSEKMVNVLINHENKIVKDENPNESSSILASYFKMGGRDQQYIKIKSATSKGYETATENDSINFSVPNSETRRGRVDKEVTQTLDTQCNQGVIIGYTRDSKGKVVSRNIWENAGTIHTSSGGGGNTDQFVLQSDYKIRRLTPKECFRLMDFPDSHYENCKKEGVSDSQLYKQAGNSVVVKMFELLIKQLLKI